MDIDFGALLPLLLAIAYLILTGIAAAKKKGSANQKRKPTKSPFEAFLNEMRKEFNPSLPSPSESPVELRPADYADTSVRNSKKEEDHFLSDQFISQEKEVLAEDLFEQHDFFGLGDQITIGSQHRTDEDSFESFADEESPAPPSKTSIHVNLRDKDELQKAIIFAEVVDKPRSKRPFAKSRSLW